MVVKFYRELSQLGSRAKRDKARRQELEWGLNKEPDQFLVGDLPPFASHPTPVDLPPPVALQQSSATLQTPPASPGHRPTHFGDVPPPV
jgi:hypothetical protein